MFQKKYTLFLNKAVGRSSMSQQRFDPRDFLNLAENLNSGGSVSAANAAVMRTIVSRAYYAAHLFLREKLRRRFPSQLQKRHLIRKRISEHKMVEELIRKNIRKPSIADKHYRLHELRKKADYDLWSVVTPDDIEKSFELAVDIIQFSEQHL